MSKEPLEDRIVELETRQAFQEKTIEDLNGVIISQQQQLDQLEVLVGKLQKRLEQLIDGLEVPGINGP